MKKKRSIILISILIIVSAVIYFYKPQHNKNNSYQLGIIISIGNKDKSNILYYNDQLQKTGQKKKQPHTVVHDCYEKTIFRI